MGQIAIVQADITTLKVDAIVNAANSSLLGGGGVDGAIHRAAGPELLAECRELHGCSTGDAKITQGYRLPATYVIHTVGPVYRDGQHGEPALLASCYRRSLELAEERDVATIAFPCISTGIYRYPFDDACRVALGVITEFLAANTVLRQVTLCCFGRADYVRYGQIARELGVELAD